jgi:hypothetical protein
MPRELSQTRTGRTASRTRSRGRTSRFRTERRGMSSQESYVQPTPQEGFQIWGRQGSARMRGRHDAPPESRYEKQMILAESTNMEPRDLAWADARFAVDIMSEHSLFFSMLMPEEVAPDEKRQAQDFQERYARLFQKIDQKGPPTAGELRGFVRNLKSEIQPLIDFKEENHKAQVKGALQSLVWPLFFDHTRREAVRWVDRIEAISEGNTELDRKEVVGFWGNIMEEHARFVAHLLDPDEYALIERSFKTSDVFQALAKGKSGPVRALVRQPMTVADSLMKNPELDAVESAAETILDFKTDAVRKIEAGKIKSIISPILADHVRRESVKFLDELKRTKEQ